MEQIIEKKEHRFSDRTFGWTAIFLIIPLVAGLVIIENVSPEPQTCYLFGIVVGCAGTMLAHFLKK